MISLSGTVLNAVEFQFIEDVQSDVVVNVNNKMNPLKCETRKKWYTRNKSMVIDEIVENRRRFKVYFVAMWEMKRSKTKNIENILHWIIERTNEHMNLINRNIFCDVSILFLFIVYHVLRILFQHNGMWKNKNIRKQICYIFVLTAFLTNWYFSFRQIINKLLLRLEILTNITYAKCQIEDIVYF